MMPTLARLSDTEVMKKLESMSNWEIHEGMLTRELKFPEYLQGISFVNAIAHLAERQQHHPDLKICYTTVTVQYSSHDAGGITDKDFDAAREVDAMSGQYLKSASKPES